jgi:hypothetical protein
MASPQSARSGTRHRGWHASSEHDRSLTLYILLSNDLHHSDESSILIGQRGGRTFSAFSALSRSISTARPVPFASMHSAHAPQLTEQEFNLSWVFSQLVALDAPDDTPSGKLKKRASMVELGSDAPALTAAHVRHVFDWMKVPLSGEEAEEVLNMMDENEDGRVTLDDFWHTMKVTPSTPFDPRYALNLPFASLDASTKDGVRSRVRLRQRWRVQSDHARDAYRNRRRCAEQPDHAGLDIAEYRIATSATEHGQRSVQEGRRHDGPPVVR